MILAIALLELPRSMNRRISSSLPSRRATRGDPYGRPGFFPDALACAFGDEVAATLAVRVDRIPDCADMIEKRLETVDCVELVSDPTGAKPKGTSNVRSADAFFLGTNEPP